jgi:tRNA dimethylallyltransferase
MTQPNKIIQVVIGPTASGKSAHALELAQNHNGVIINCDSMQSYDALHVLTAQPSADDQKIVLHKLYSHLHPATHYSAADWRNDAVKEIENAFECNQTPIICGGTGFYLKALMEGLSPIPEIPKEVRDHAIALQLEIGQEKFFELLQSKDPMTASKIDAKNPQRTMRAWEVLEHTGKPLAQWQEEPLMTVSKDWTFYVTGILPDRDHLKDRIDNRLGIMMDQGILSEVEILDSLIQSGDVSEGALVTKAYGFRPFCRYLNNEITLDEAIEQTRIETRQYAKRQMTWLRNQINIDKIL